MAHTVGERMHCDSCGAEIVYVEACTCPEDEPGVHSNVCCGEEMRSLGVVATTEPPRTEA